MKTYIFRANDDLLTGNQYLDAMRATAQLMPTQSPDIIEAHDFAEAHNLRFVFDENLTFLYVMTPETDARKEYTPDELERTCITMWRQGIDKTLDLMDYKEPYLDADALEAAHDYATRHRLLYVFDKYGNLEYIKTA